MKKRIFAGILLVLMVIAIFILPVEFFYLLYLVLALICCNEFMHMLETGGMKSFKIISYAFVILFTAALYNSHHDFLWNIIPWRNGGFLLIFSIFMLILLTTAVFSRKFDLKSVIYSVFGIMYSVVLLGFAILIIELPQGKWLLGFLLVGAVASDTFAYFIGYFLGKRKIVPEISPKKTVEGSIGGLMGSIVFMTIYILIMKAVAGQVPELWKIIVIIPVSGVVAQLGDWTASYMKRQFSIKDFGRLIPGHGGLLDRVDSIIFLLPVLYFIFII